MRRALVALLALWASTTNAQEVRKAYWASLWDVDSDSTTYCVELGIGNNPWGAAKPGGGLIESSGSSATWTAVTAGALPFANIAVGDVIYAYPPGGGTPTTRLVTAKADGDGITVQTAADISAGAGYTFTFRTKTCGTAITDGWIDVSAYSDLTAVLQYDQGDLATGLEARVECKQNSDNTVAVPLYPVEGNLGCGTGTEVSGYCLFATAPASLAFDITGRWDACRIGVRRSGADTSDATTNLESVTITLLAGQNR